MEKNGSSPPDPIAAQIEALDALIEEERVKQRPIRMQLEQSEDRLRRLSAAANALQGVDAPPKKRGRPRATGSGVHQKAVGEENLKRVLARAKEMPETFTLRDLHLTDLSDGTVDRALKRLREREQIRLVSRNGGAGGAAFVYALLDG